jgi:peptidyl-prolyl cis-trans isomerase D
MLGVMRKYKQSIIIKFVFGIIVLSFVGTIFLVWGKGDSGLKGSEFVAKVNRTKIPTSEYLRTMDNLRRIYEQIYNRSINAEMEKQLGLKKLALDNLIDKVLVRQEAKRMGIKINRDEIAAEIAKIPSFQKNGAFDFEQYQQMLRSIRTTPAEFEDAQEEELLIKKAKQKIKDQVKVSDEDALKAFHKQNDKVELAYASISAADVKGTVKVTDQDLTAYLQKNPDEFKTPEQISISYTLIDPAKVAGKVNITDEEIQNYYQKNIDRYQGKGGILPLSEVKERAKADAIRNKTAKEAYEKAADAINKFSKNADLNGAAASLGSKVTDSPLFTANAPAATLVNEPELLKRAFALKAGELGGPVETKNGIYILKIKERQAPAVPPLDRIRDRVTAKVMAQKTAEQMTKKAEETLALLRKGDAGVKLETTGSFGYSEKGDIPRIGTSKDAMEAAFNLTTAAPVPMNPFKIGERWYVFKLKGRQGADKAQFEKSKEQLKQSMLPKLQEEALEKWLKDLRAKAKIETNPLLLADN